MLPSLSFMNIWMTKCTSKTVCLNWTEYLKKIYYKKYKLYLNYLFELLRPLGKEQPGTAGLRHKPTQSISDLRSAEWLSLTVIFICAGFLHLQDMATMCQEDTEDDRSEPSWSDESFFMIQRSRSKTMLMFKWNLLSTRLSDKRNWRMRRKRTRRRW